MYITDIIGLIGAVIAAISSIVMTSLGVISSRKNVISNKPKIDNDKNYELLLRGIEQQTLDENAVQLIYNQSITKKKKSVSYLYFLESFLYHIRQEDRDGQLTKSATNIIYPLIEKEKAEKPYTNVNDRERRILLAIEDTVKDDEKNSIKNHLKELSIAIEEKQNALDRAQRTNKWSLPASILGSLLTLIFGLYSLFA